jgi:hypothetical protein
MTTAHKSAAVNLLAELRGVITVAEGLLLADCRPSHLPCTVVATLAATARLASHRLGECVEGLLRAMHGRAPGCGPCRFKKGQ